MEYCCFMSKEGARLKTIQDNSCIDPNDNFHSIPSIPHQKVMQFVLSTRASIERQMKGK